MSNHKAIATVTAAIRYVIQSAVQSAVPQATVTTVRPDISGSGLPSTGINIFLFQVTPNAALRNADLPTRRADGTLVRRPTAAIDLHYLFSFYGDDTIFQTQLLLGSTLTALHTSPALSRDQITATLLDPTLSVLAGSNLADALDLVRFTPIGLSLEELSKLWSVFLQTPYVLSIAFQAGPVLLDDETDVVGTTLPVLKRPRVHALAAGSPIQPGISAVLAQASSAAPPAAHPILVGYTLVLDGAYVASAATRVLIDGASVANITADGKPISLVLAPALGLRAGAHSVQVVQELATGEQKVTVQAVQSNMATFILQPIINPPLTKSTSGTKVTLTVSLTPKVAKLQRVRLLLDELNPPSTRPPSTYAIDAPLSPADDADPIIDVTSVPAGTYLARVQVDGAESVLATDPIAGFTGPTVTL